MNQHTIYGPEPITLDGRQGRRYWVQHLYSFSGNPSVDERLSGYPVAVFQPHGRPAHETPIVIALQGMAAPYQWNAFLVPTLLNMGIACVLFDTPLAGERSLVRNYKSDIVSEVVPLLEQNIEIKPSLVAVLMDCVARDLQTALRLARERHGLQDGRVALFGVSLGTLLASFAFLRDGVGGRLLGTLGHADLYHFARSYTPSFTPLIVSLPARLLGKLATLVLGQAVAAGIDFLAVLHNLCTGGGHCIAANPMTFIDRVGPDRRIRFLVGQDDSLVKSADAVACARRFPDGECFVVPGLGHGGSRFGPSFVDHARTFVGTQLGDWKW